MRPGASRAAGWNNPPGSDVPTESHGRINSKKAMAMYVSIGPLVALVAGILILIVPRLLNYIVAIYLIIIGLLGLFGPRL